MNRGKNNSKMLVAAVLIITAALFYVLNYITPLYADDYSYTYTFAVTEGKYRISNFNELILSQLNHYKVMNGRSVVHFLAQLFLMWGKPVFNIINSLAFVALGVLIYFHAFGTAKKLRALPLVGIFFMLWLITPAFGQSFLWVTGASNYLWGILIILLYLVPFRFRAEKEPSEISGMEEDRRNPIFANLLKAAAMFVFGIIAGWTNENNAIALIAVVILFIIRELMMRKKIGIWMISGLVGNVIGCLIMLLAPGESTRLAGFGGFGTVLTWIKRFFSISLSAGYYLMIPALIFVIAFIVYVVKRRPAGIKKAMEEISVPLIFLVGTLGATYSMIVAPYFPTRAWSGPVVFCIITAMSMCRCAESVRLKTWLKITLSAVMAAVFALTYAGALQNLEDVYLMAEERESVILSAKVAGKDTAEIEPITSQSKYSCYTESDDISQDSSQWPNTAIAMYYDMEEIIKK